MRITSLVTEPPENYVTSPVCHTCDYAQGLPPLTPSRTGPSRSIPPLRRSCRGNALLPSVSNMMECFGQVASCINHTSGEHKMLDQLRESVTTAALNRENCRAVGEFQLNLLTADLDDRNYYLTAVSSVAKNRNSAFIK